MIQDKIPLLEPCLRLILVIPGCKDGMIQDEIRLRRQSRRTFVADGYGESMIQDKIDMGRKFP
jgi:hypothetical protein